MERIETIPELETLAEVFIRALTALPDGVREGTVMTAGPPPYRRVDCDGRALAYVRTRPRKGVVRVDVSGLWLTDRVSALRVASANGGGSLLVRTRHEVPEAIRYVRDAIIRTRAAQRRGVLSVNAARTGSGIGYGYHEGEGLLAAAADPD